MKISDKKIVTQVPLLAMSGMSVYPFNAMNNEFINHVKKIKIMEILCKIFKDRKLTNSPSTRDISRTSIHIFQSGKVTNNNFSGGIK